MNQAANVKSLDALEQFRGSLAIFRHEAESALGTIRSELSRFMQWLEHDQLAHWQHEIRVREERLGEAKADLHRCLAATIDPRRTPSCYQEKKALAAAKARLEEAEHKLATLRRWIPVVREAAFEYTARAEPLGSTLSGEIPAASALLARALEHLLAYQTVEPPAASAAPTASPPSSQRAPHHRTDPAP